MIVISRFLLYSHSRTSTNHFSVYFDFNTNNKHMLLLRKVRRAIVEGIDIDVHILLACYERTQLYVSIQMSLLPDDILKLLTVLRSSTVHRRKYVLWLSAGFRRHSHPKHFKVHVCKFSYKPWHVHVHVVLVIFNLRQLMDTVWETFQSWISS